ncbi:hypothetical protein BDC45DRAFT_508740, partial [Circinella umbellata]
LDSIPPTMSLDNSSPLLSHFKGTRKLCQWNAFLHLVFQDNERSLVDCEDDNAPTMAELSAAFHNIRKNPLPVNDLKNRERVAKMYRREISSILTRAKSHLGWDIGVLLASDNKSDWDYTDRITNSEKASRALRALGGEQAFLDKVKESKQPALTQSTTTVKHKLKCFSFLIRYIIYMEYFLGYEAPGRNLKTFPWSRFKRHDSIEDGWRYRYEEGGFDMIGFDFDHEVARNSSEMGTRIKFAKIEK